MESAGVRYLHTSCFCIRNRTSEISDTSTTIKYSIERFHSSGQLYKFIGTKESVYIRKEFNSLRICLVHQHGRRFIILQHQNERRDVM